MEWKDVGAVVGKAAPILGTLLAGATGGVSVAVGALVAAALGTDNTPEAINNAIATDPQASLKLAMFESENKAKLQAMAFAHADNVLAADTANLAAVNQTMQAEVKAEHWWSSGWRPYCGFIFGTTFFSVYVILPLAKLQVPVIPLEAWASIGAILGVASWFRGKAQADPQNPMQNVG